MYSLIDQIAVLERRSSKSKRGEEQQNSFLDVQALPTTTVFPSWSNYGYCMPVQPDDAPHGASCDDF